MTREEHLAYCKICLNRKMDLKQGLVCSLTDNLANFELTCPNFKEDAVKIAELNAIPTQEVVDSSARINNGAQWFLWIFGLSVVNSVILFFGGGVSFIFGLGITQLFEGIYIGMFGELDFVALILSVLISGIFAVIWFFSKRLSKPAFLIGMLLYGLDALLLLAFQDWLSVGVHLYALFMIFKGFQSIDSLKENLQS